MIDFGLAIDINKEKPVSCLGTLEYVAPEVFIDHSPDKRGVNDDSSYSSACDIWGVGVLTYELLTGKPPFERDMSAPDNVCQLEGFKQLLLTVEPELPSYLSPDAVSFINSTMNKDPAQRLSSTELLNLPFIRPYMQMHTLSRAATSPSDFQHIIPLQSLLSASGSIESLSRSGSLVKDSNNSITLVRSKTVASQLPNFSKLSMEISRRYDRESNEGSFSLSTFNAFPAK